MSTHLAHLWVRKTKSTRENWAAEKYDFYKIAHERLHAFRKLQEDENPSKYRLSANWRWAGPGITGLQESKTMIAGMCSSPVLANERILLYHRPC